MRNVRTFTSYGADLPVAIDMHRIEAVMAHVKGGVLIVTGSDTYHVEGKFGDVLASWHDATQPEKKPTKRSTKNG